MEQHSNNFREHSQLFENSVHFVIVALRKNFVRLIRNMRNGSLRSCVKWQGIFRQEGMKQTGMKQELEVQKCCVLYKILFVILYSWLLFQFFKVLAVTKDVLITLWLTHIF